MGTNATKYGRMADLTQGLVSTGTSLISNVDAGSEISVIVFQGSEKMTPDRLMDLLEATAEEFGFESGQLLFSGQAPEVTEKKKSDLFVQAAWKESSLPAVRPVAVVPGEPEAKAQMEAAKKQVEEGVPKKKSPGQQVSIPREE